MTFQPLIAAVLAATIGLAARAADAEPPASSPALASAAPSARALQLATRYLAAAQAQRILSGEGPTIAQFMLSKVPEPAGGPAKAEEVRSAMLDAADAAVKARLPEFLQKSAVIYAKVFTEQELADIVAFYDSPSGRAFVLKTDAASASMAEVIRSLGEELKSDTRAGFCAKEPQSCR
jgi:hypothetical protein